MLEMIEIKTACKSGTCRHFYTVAFANSGVAGERLRSWTDLLTASHTKSRGDTNCSPGVTEGAWLVKSLLWDGPKGRHPRGRSEPETNQPSPELKCSSILESGLRSFKIRWRVSLLPAYPSKYKSSLEKINIILFSNYFYKVPYKISGTQSRRARFTRKQDNMTKSQEKQKTRK